MNEKKMKSKGLLMALLLLLLGTAGIGGTLAYLSAKSGSEVTNEWKIMQQPVVTVNHAPQGVTMTVKLPEIGHVTADTDQPYMVYLRAKPEFFWEGTTLTDPGAGSGGDGGGGMELVSEEPGNEWEGTILGEKPQKGIDYDFDWNESDWFQGEDGYYYYKKPVSATADGRETAYLYRRTQVDNERARRFVINGDSRVQFIISEKCAVQCVQASGTTAGNQKAVNDAWGSGIKVNEDGTLSPSGGASNP